MDTLTTLRRSPAPTAPQTPAAPAWRVRAMLEAMAWARTAGVPFSKHRAVKAL
jgi:hypothetical protein